MSIEFSFKVALLGLSRHDERVLRTIFVISSTRKRSYVLGEVDSSVPPDIIMINTDQPAAMDRWLDFHQRWPRVPTVMMAHTPPLDSSHSFVQHPIVASRLLKTLDAIELVAEQVAKEPLFSARTEVTATGTASTPMIPRATGSPTTALVVDDSLPIRKQMEIELSSVVSKIDIAASAEQAFEFIDQKIYDIIFLDVVLPGGVDGYGICRRIKRDKGKKHTPVIMLTGKSSPFDKVKGKLAGCNTYLTKPLDRGAFEKVIEKYLNKDSPAPTMSNVGWSKQVTSSA